MGAVYSQLRLLDALHQTDLRDRAVRGFHRIGARDSHILDRIYHGLDRGISMEQTARLKTAISAAIVQHSPRSKISHTNPMCGKWPVAAGISSRSNSAKEWA